MSALDLVRALAVGPLAASVGSCDALRARVAADGGADTVARAALGGLASASPGWAFACGYEAALARLDPAATSGGRLAALCATEEGGGHPRAIRTSLAPGPDGSRVLRGRKTWVTLGAAAQVLLVVASEGADEAGRNRLRVARVPASRHGVGLEPGAATPFAPEIGHARVRFDDVAVAEGELLAGDGYEAYLKPFRTVEDVHVMAALAGWAIGVGRASAWEAGWLDEALALVVLLRALGAEDPSRAEAHVALAGAMAAARRLLLGADWSRAAPPVREAWERDRALLDVAGTVRAARRDAAWRRLAP